MTVSTPDGPTPAPCTVTLLRSTRALRDADEELEDDVLEGYDEHHAVELLLDELDIEGRSQMSKRELARVLQQAS